MDAPTENVMGNSMSLPTRAIAHPPAWRRVAVSLITAYQRYISPHKGFTCPHLLVHRGVSCSAYIKGVFLREETFSGALQLALARFGECSQASHTLAQGPVKCYVIPCCFSL